MEHFQKYWCPKPAPRSSGFTSWGVAWTKGFLKSLQVVLICTVGEIFQLCICKKWICLHGMEDTSSFWVLSQTEPSSSALEESTCRKHPSNSSVLDWGDCAPQGTSRSVWRHVYFTTGEGIYWLWVVRCQRCRYISYSSQDSLHIKEWSSSNIDGAQIE